MLALPALLALGSGARAASACAFAGSGASLPDDGIHRRLAAGFTYPVMPRPPSTENNAFVTSGLLQPIRQLSGNDRRLYEVLADFAAKRKEHLCYWPFQGLPPPRGGPTLFHPFRGYWDVSDGHHDQDIEWVQAYGEVAVARLHSMIRKGGPVVSAMCAIGAKLARRRCDNGRSRRGRCVPAITNASIAWPMAVSIWKVGHPDLHSAVSSWRGRADVGHMPNIEWALRLGGIASPARPWSGAMPRPGEAQPRDMPQGPAFPVSQDAGWGAPKIAKVVKCPDIPPAFMYPADVLYCDHLPNETSSISTVDEAYAAWRSLKSEWPPTRPCADDLPALRRLLAKVGLSSDSCADAYAKLQGRLPNFDCDNADTLPKIRDVCCSVCGGQPVPDVPPPSPPPQRTSWACEVCDHAYDEEGDGNGTAFEALPDTWACPVCGAPKSAYVKQASGEWAHPSIVV